MKDLARFSGECNDSPSLGQSSQVSTQARLITISDEEADQLNAYHVRVLATVGPLVDADVRAWLEQACAPL